MDNLSAMLWVEVRKAIRSGIPFWTALGSICMPLGIALLIFAARNPEYSQKLGLISTKANLITYSAIDWTAYLGLSGQIVAGGGLILFVLVISWVFGREFVDGTLKDMLAVPIARSTILLAKFIVVAAWSIMLTLVILSISLSMGMLIDLPGGSIATIFQGSTLVITTASLVITTVMPFALLASVGRGYLLPIGIAVLTLIITNMVILAGWGEYFPWGVAGLYAQEKSLLRPLSYGIVVLTGLTGIITTYLWWQRADQNR